MSRNRRAFSRFYPRSLSGQLMVSLLVALIIAHVISFLILADERHGAIASAQRDQILARTASIVWVLEETPTELRQHIADAASTVQLRFTVTPESSLDTTDPSNSTNRLARRMAQLLEREQGTVLVALQERDFWDWSESNGPRHGMGETAFDTERRWRSDDDDHDDDDDDHEDEDDEDDEEEDEHKRPADWRWNDRHHVTNLSLSIRLSGNEWLNADYRLYGSRPGWAKATLLTVGLVGFAVYLVTFLMLRRLTRPLKDLAAAAESLGRGEDVASLDETGPEEIQQTTQAFNHMKDSLKRYVDDRTRMLAAISHDLRTPMTTLRLRAEMLEEGEAKTKILETLDEMKRMTEATLAFAREDATREETRTVDLSALIESVVLDLQDLGCAITFKMPDAISCRCRPFGLKRALRNLFENAVQYGDQATVAVMQSTEGIQIVIEDIGPGIPAEAHERVFEPFVRMEESRSTDTGGIGLGLAIARTIIRAHGGDIALSNRPEGGLSVQVNLPPEISG